MLLEKKSFIPIVIFCIFYVSLGLVSAACTVNGRQVPCDYFFKNYGWIFIAIPIFLIIWIILLVKMILDAYNKMSEYPDIFDYKWILKWIIIYAITGGLGIIVYYFIVYRRYKHKDIENLVTKKPLADREILSIPANHFRKLSFPYSWIMNILFLNFLNPYGYADGGKLIISKSKFIFKAHSFNMPGGNIEINFSEVKQIKNEAGANSKVKNITIKVKTTEERFVIWKSQEKMFIESLKKA